MSKALKNKTKLNDIISVKDFGAVGDGVADDTAAINAALTIAGNVSTSTNYRAVFLPDGNYKASNLVIPHGVRLFGNGVNQCQIIVTDTPGTWVSEGNL